MVLAGESVSRRVSPISDDSQFDSLTSKRYIRREKRIHKTSIYTFAQYALVLASRGLTKNRRRGLFEYPLLLSVGSPEGSIFLSECDTFGFGARRRVSNGAAGDLCPPEGITSRHSTRSPALGRLLTAQYSTGSCFASPALILAKVSDEQAGVTSNVHYFRLLWPQYHFLRCFE